MKKAALYSEHLGELRTRFLVCLGILLVAAAAAWFLTDVVLAAAASPVGQLVFLYPAEAFLIKLKLSFFMGGVLASPAFLYQFWRYISPALLESERVYGWLLPASYVLLLLGGAFGFFFVWPAGIKFLLSYQSETLKALMSAREYFGMLFCFLIAFGAVFQMPLLILFLSLTGLVTPDFLSSKRKHAILVIFVMAAMLTPGPDVFSQVMLAAPMMIFFEAGILISRLAARRADHKNA